MSSSRQGIVLGASVAAPVGIEPAGSGTADARGTAVVDCRGCDASVSLAAISTLSTHRTSGGLVIYFRCPDGHAGFYETSTTQEVGTDMDALDDQRCASAPAQVAVRTHGERRSPISRAAAWTAAAVVTNLLFLTAPMAAGAAEGNADAAHLCRQDGYLALVGAGGETFASAGQCVAFAAHGGTFSAGLVIPAGATATLSQVSFGGACDPLSYGYQVGTGPLVTVDSKPSGCPYTAPVTGATVGPFPTAVGLRIFLQDHYCGGGPEWTYYSDGNHALVSPVAPGVYFVGITDSFLCTVPSSTPRRPSGPGTGNLRLTLTIN